MKTEKEVLTALARAIKQIDSIKTINISDLDQFYIDIARENMFKVIRSNGYKLDDRDYRLKKIK